MRIHAYPNENRVLFLLTSDWHTISYSSPQKKNHSDIKCQEIEYNCTTFAGNPRRRLGVISVCGVGNKDITVKP